MTTIRPIIKTSRSRSYSGNLNEHESLHSWIPIHLSNFSTKLDYVVQNYQILSATHILLNLRISNYSHTSIFLNNLTITPKVDVNLLPQRIKIKKVELPSWKDYLKYDSKDGEVKFTCHENTSLEFYSGQLFATKPIIISVTFSLTKPLPKIGTFCLAIALSESAAAGEIKETQSTSAVLPQFSGHMFGREFHFIRTIKQQNMLGSTPQSFIQSLIEDLHNTEVKTLIMMEMKNHFIQSINQKNSFTIKSLRLAEYAEYYQALQACITEGNRLIKDAKKHCINLNFQLTHLQLSAHPKTIDMLTMRDIVKLIDPTSLYLNGLETCIQEKINLKNAINALLNDKNTIIDYLKSNLELVCRSRPIMIAWAISKKITLRIWECYEANIAAAPKQIFPGQYRVVEKNKTLDVLHNNIDDSYFSLITVKNAQRFLTTPLALKLRLFDHVPTSPVVAEEKYSRRVRFALDC